MANALKARLYALRAGRMTNELGMWLKINKIVGSRVELPGKDCDKSNQ
jgi:hypothetical protein